MSVVVVGCGYVGLVVANCLASMGQNVVAVDKDSEKISFLRRGGMPIYEPQLKDLQRENEENKRISYTTDLKSVVVNTQFFFLCVDTPYQENGEVELSSVFSVIEEMGGVLEKGKYSLIIIKSTAPVGSCRKISEFLEGKGLRKSEDFDVVSNPEFFREGKAVGDFFHPDRVIVGCESLKSQQLMETLYKDFQERGVPFLFCNFETAELIKYASNTFLGVKISFVNEMANLCENLSADVDLLVRGLGMDRRINSHNLNPGPGYGGSCLPKDSLALLEQGKSVGVALRVVEASIEVNIRQRDVVVGKVREALQGELSGKKLGVLGLAFKAGTDDVRDSAALGIIRELSRNDAILQIYDPEAIEKAKVELGDLKGVNYCEGEYEAVRGVDAILILTEWEIFAEMDYEMKVKELVSSPVVIDARNVLRRDEMVKWGYSYSAMGRTLGFNP
jgi:UDPglucose 6-dehydrogenase